MAGVHATPEELDKFTGTLESYLDIIESETDRLKAAFGELGDSWQDQQKSRFLICGKLRRIYAPT